MSVTIVWKGCTFLFYHISLSVTLEKKFFVTSLTCPLGFLRCLGNFLPPTTSDVVHSPFPDTLGSHILRIFDGDPIYGVGPDL